MYRIYWKVNKTNQEGHGEGTITYKSAKLWLDKLNNKYKDTMNHWIIKEIDK
jgi:hypothetical protein